MPTSDNIVTDAGRQLLTVIITQRKVYPAGNIEENEDPKTVLKTVLTLSIIYCGCLRPAKKLMMSLESSNKYQLPSFSTMELKLHEKTLLEAFHSIDISVISKSSCCKTYRG